MTEGVQIQQYPRRLLDVQRKTAQTAHTAWEKGPFGQRKGPHAGPRRRYPPRLLVESPPHRGPHGNGGARDRVSSTRSHESRPSVFPSPSVAAHAGGLRLRARAPHEPDGAVDYTLSGTRRAPAGELAAMGARCVRARRASRPARPPVRGSG